MRKPGIKVFAPASVSNVAVGFDILGFALDAPGDEIIVREGTQPGLVITDIKGAKGKLPFDVMKNTAGYAAYKLLEYLKETDRPIEMEIHKKMPVGSGLGSSAASAAGGVFAVSEFLKTGLTKQELLPFAVAAEKMADGTYHADNAAPSLLGGMILIRDNDTLDFKKLPVPKGLYATVIQPDMQILTRDSRSILKEEVNFQAVIRQSGNLAAFVSAMYTSDYGLMSRSLQDLLVEPQRAHLIPHFYTLKEEAIRLGALGFSISGAGPSMFAMCDNSGVAEEIAKTATTIYNRHKIQTTTYISGINHEGTLLY